MSLVSDSKHFTTSNFENKKIIKLALISALFTVLTTSATAFAGGSGTSSEPYQ